MPTDIRAPRDDDRKDYTTANIHDQASIDVEPSFNLKRLYRNVSWLIWNLKSEAELYNLLIVLSFDDIKPRPHWRL